MIDLIDMIYELYGDQPLTFEVFKARIKDGIQSGALKLSEVLNELDLAIVYAISMERRAQVGRELKIAVDKIYDLVGEWCGTETRDRLFAE